MEHAYQAAGFCRPAGSPGDPRTFKEAMAGPDADKWYEAMTKHSLKALLSREENGSPS
jgi:hypothetical protein